MRLSVKERAALGVTANALDAAEKSIAKALRLVEAQWCKAPSAICPADRQRLLDATNDLNAARWRLRSLLRSLVLHEQLEEGR